MYTLEETVEVLLNYNVLAERPLAWSRDNVRGLREVLNDFDFYTDGDGYCFMPSEMDCDEDLVACMRRQYEVPSEVAEAALWELDISIDALAA